jgi:deazaflavin-dependent oxidoreductase (nitroreductase family)
MPHDAARQPAGSARVRLMMRVGGTLHRCLYRLSGGRLGGALGPMPVLLLTTTGRKSGQPRTWPVGYFRDGARLIITASAGGEPTHPAWYRNLRANPRVTVQLGRATRPMLARPATGAERARLWAHLVGEYPNFAAYQQQTTREIPVVILTATAE